MLVGACEGRREACYVVMTSAVSSTFATDAIVTMFQYTIQSIHNGVFPSNSVKGTP